MSIEDCDIPVGSLLDRSMIENAYFRDSYCAPLANLQASPVTLFFGIFGHHPNWMKAILLIRNQLAVCFGLDAPTVSEIIRVSLKSSYHVGDKIGPWPIFALTETELIAGRDNKHLDFRLSLFRASDSGAPNVTVSTVCTVHNPGGKLYLFFIVPFHKWGVKYLITRAMQSGRL